MRRLRTLDSPAAAPTCAVARSSSRTDFNVPREGDRILDDTRIRAAVPTLRELAAAGAQAARLLALRPAQGQSAARIRACVRWRAASGRALSAEVAFADGLRRRRRRGAAAATLAPAATACSRTCASTPARRPTTRVRGASSRASPSSTSTTRSAPRTAPTPRSSGVPERVEAQRRRAAPGREVGGLERLLAAPEQPFVAILGGAKIKDKIETIENLLPRARRAAPRRRAWRTPSSRARCALGNSLVAEDEVDLAAATPRATRRARRRAPAAERRGGRPIASTSTARAAPATRRIETRPSTRCPTTSMAVDLGPRTLATRSRRRSRRRRRCSGTVRSACSRQPPFDAGTRAVARGARRVPRLHGDRRRRDGRGGDAGRRGGPHRPRLDRRRRVARAARRAQAARRRGAAPTAAQRASRRELERASRRRASAAVFAANWKMNLLRADAEAYADRLRRELAAVDRRAPGDVVAVPVRHPPAGGARSGLDGSSRWGGQDLHPGGRGRAHRRRLRRAARRLRAASWVLCGHSERRASHGESDALVARKVAAGAAARARAAALRRRDRAEREAERTEAVLAASSKRRSPPARRVGVWALGLRAGVGDRHRADRDPGARPGGPRLAAGKLVAARLGARRRRARCGSSTAARSSPRTPRELFAQPDIDGFLVGGASLDPGAFLDIIAPLRALTPLARAASLGPGAHRSSPPSARRSSCDLRRLLAPRHHLLFLILVVLLQQGKGADLSVFGGGTTQAAFGARGPRPCCTS